MQTSSAKGPRVIVVDGAHPDTRAIEEAASLLRAGGLVAFPTETVYGLGARALDGAAIRRIFEAKGRPAAHPVIAHVEGESQALLLAAEWSALASKLARAFWPGPLTIVAPKKSHVPSELTGGGDTVGIRAPSHPVARALLTAFGEPIAAPSANRFQEVSPTRAAHVVKSLGARVDLVLDGGCTDRGIESTVVAIEEETRIVVLRPGSITLEDLRAFGDVVFEARNAESHATRMSPGLDAKHYAPRARLVVSARHDMASAIRDASHAGAIFVGKKAEIGAREVRALPADATGFAAALFATLHDLDDAGCDVVVVEAPPDTEAWLAVRDRLARAKS